METTTQKIDLKNLEKSRWESFRFEEIASKISDTVDPNTTTLETYVGLEHLDAEDIHIPRKGKPDDVSGGKLRCYPGDVIFGKRRAYQRKAAIVDFEGICSAHAFVFRANPEIIHPKLFPFFLHSDQFMHRMVDISVGGLSPTINWGDLKHQKFLLPPKDQQAQLAELLWAMDEVIEREREVLEKTSSYIECLIHENLTSSIGGKTLADYCDNDGIRIGPFGSLLHVKDYIQKGVPVIMPANIIDGKIHTNQIATISHNKAIELERYRVETNDIIFPRRGELSKRTIINERQNGWICGTGSIRVRLKEEYNSKLAYYALTSQFVNAWLLDGSVGTTMPNLNASTISKIPLNLPEGHKADDILNEIELALKAKDINMNHMESSKALKKSLINQIF